MVQKIHPRCVIWVPSIPPHAVHLSENKMTTQLSSMKMSMAWVAVAYWLFYVHVPLSRIKYVLHTIFFKSSICTTCKMVSQLTARNASYLYVRAEGVTLGVSPSLVSRYCEGYRTLNLRFHKARTKIEVVLRLPSWLSQLNCEILNLRSCSL